MTWKIRLVLAILVGVIGGLIGYELIKILY